MSFADYLLKERLKSRPEYKSRLELRMRMVRDPNCTPFDLHQEMLEPGMVAFKFLSESPSFNARIESSLVRFLALQDFLDGPRQRRPF